MSYKHKLVIPITSIVILCLIVFTPYINVFGWELSKNHSNWGEFGSYLSGTLGTPLIIINLLIIFYLSLSERKKNDKEVKLSRMQDRLERFMILITEKCYKERKLYLHIPHLVEDLGWRKENIEISCKTELGIVEVRNRENNKIISMRDCDPFTLLKGYSNLTTPEKARKALIDNNIELVLSDYNTFKETVNYIVKLLTEMINLGYSISLAQSTLSLIYEPSKVLHSMGYFDTELFKRIGLIQSLPSNHPNKISLNINHSLADDLKESKDISIKPSKIKLKAPILYNPSTGIHLFEFVNKDNNFKFDKRKKDPWEITKK